MKWASLEGQFSTGEAIPDRGCSRCNGGRRLEWGLLGDLQARGRTAEEVVGALEKHREGSGSHPEEGLRGRRVCNR